MCNKIILLEFILCLLYVWMYFWELCCFLSFFLFLVLNYRVYLNKSLHMSFWGWGSQTSLHKVWQRYLWMDSLHKSSYLFGWFWRNDFGVGGYNFSRDGDEYSVSFNMFSQIITSKEINLLLDLLYCFTLLCSFWCHTCPWFCVVSLHKFIFVFGFKRIVVLKMQIF